MGTGLIMVGLALTRREDLFWELDSCSWSLASGYYPFIALKEG
jgi:hypothetical protein